MPSPFPCASLIREWLWEKIQIKKKEIAGRFQMAPRSNKLAWATKIENCEESDIEKKKIKEILATTLNRALIRLLLLL